ncbi:hypothetical protein ACQ4PT_043486 [Festuca glaucescens]
MYFDPSSTTLSSTTWDPYHPLLGVTGGAAPPAAPPHPRLRPHGHLAVASLGGALLPPLTCHRLGPPLLRRLLPCPSSPPPSDSGQATALAALLDALPGLAKTTRVAVAGSSYGGFVAYALARAAGPSRVGPVVISNSDLLKTAEDDMALLQRAGGEWASTADLLMPLDARTARRLMELTFYRRQLTAMLPDFVIGETVQKLFTDKREEKIELMKAITVGTDEFQVTPLEQDVLLIWGDHDQIFPLDKAFAVKRCLGENVRLEIFKETGHVPQMEDPNGFSQVVLDFLLASQKSPN